MKIDTSNLTANPSSAFSALLGGESVKQGQKNNQTGLSIDELIPYENQPFHPYNDEALLELADDIQMNGILSPVIVRPYNGKYQILAGHNRTEAAKLVGLKTIPCIIKDVDDDTAALIMTNTNLCQRQGLLPSEKAFAYLTQMKALKNKHISDTGSEVAAQNNDSRTNIFRYVRLTSLYSPILEWVDNGTLPFRAGVNISYISSVSQELLHDIVVENDLKISLKQSEQLKTYATECDGELSQDTIINVLMKKPAAKTPKKIKLEWDLISEFFPEGSTENDVENAIYNALKLYYQNETAPAE